LYGENLSLISEIENKIKAEAKTTKNLTIKKYQEEYLLQNKDIFDQLINTESCTLVIDEPNNKVIKNLQTKIEDKWILSRLNSFD